MPYVPAGAYPAVLATPVPATGGAPTLGAVPATAQKDITSARERESWGDQHLRSADEVTGYHVHARDGEIGHVEDLLFEGGDWSIRYFIVDTKNWWPGKLVLVQSDWIETISWEERSVYVARNRDEIKRAPEYDPSKPIDTHSHQTS